LICKISDLWHLKNRPKRTLFTQNINTSTISMFSKHFKIFKVFGHFKVRWSGKTDAALFREAGTCICKDLGVTSKRQQRSRLTIIN
jgi:hypothetical protein